MFKRIYLAGLIVLLLLPGAAYAQGPVRPQHSDPTWHAAYWNNTTLSGAPALTREEENINYDWWDESPEPDVVDADQFSARWTRYIDVTPGDYWFTVTSDDGARLWVDDELIIDAWYDHPAERFSIEKEMGPGHHLITLEYYEHQGAASVALSWMLSDDADGGWLGEYFNNVTLSGAPVLTRTDPEIDFAWGVNSPEPLVVAHDRFSTRWTRVLVFDTGMVRFSMTVDDGARLWVNGHLLIDAWQDQPPTTYTGDIFLTGGPVTVEMQYYENAGGATAQLSWQAVDDDEPQPPTRETVIIDDLAPQFVTSGSAATWRVSFEGYQGHLTWTTNLAQKRADANWARWYPVLAPGAYEVYAFIPFRYTTTSQAQYEIWHAGGMDVRTIDQSDNGARWVSLGTYLFQGTNLDYVALSNVTGEFDQTRLVAFDAIKWEPR